MRTPGWRHPHGPGALSTQVPFCLEDATAPSMYIGVRRFCQDPVKAESGEAADYNRRRAPTGRPPGSPYRFIMKLWVGVALRLAWAQALCLPGATIRVAPTTGNTEAMGNHPHSHILGIDGGGTRTTAWLADARGRVLARSVSGPSNPLKVGFEAAQRELLKAARRAAREAELVDVPLQAVCVGLAGVARPAVHRRMSLWLRRAIPARAHLLTSDAAIGLQAALGTEPGIIVISGTGSIGYGRDAHDRADRSGGWGSLFDDVGSGYDIGRKAIVAALHAYDGRGPNTLLGSEICKALHLKDITWIVHKRLAPNQIAGLFPLVIQAARHRDAVARRLLGEAGRDLAELALALIGRFHWQRQRVPVVLAGGVFQASRQVRLSFADYVKQRAPLASFKLLRRPAVEGALMLARELANR
jgi:N-acetylglucosamine kinase-like BadF-type ATPase